MLYVAIAAVLLTLIIGAGAAIVANSSHSDRAHSVPAGHSYQLPESHSSLV